MAGDLLVVGEPGANQLAGAAHAFEKVGNGDWVEVRSFREETQGLVGYYGGNLTFIEPMVSRALLLERGPFDLKVPTVPDVPAGSAQGDQIEDRSVPGVKAP